jgi:hypothetical protein
VSGIPFGAAGQGRARRWTRWLGWRPWRRTSAAARAYAKALADIPPFQPTPVDKEEERAWVKREVWALPPGSVDEAHERVLDRHIDRRGRQWIAQVKREFADYVGWLRQLRRAAEGAVLHRQNLQTTHDYRVAEALAGRTAAGNRLSGDDDEGKWHQAEHSNPSLLAGRSWASWFYLVAVLLAGLADFTAFYQVMERVLPDLDGRLLIVLVTGFTAMALMLAHYIGVFLRDRQAGSRSNHPVLFPVCAVLWFSLGVMAFWVRWKVNPGSSSGGTLPTGGDTLVPAQTTFQNTLPGAAMFAAFYYATGAAAIIGSYLNHNPLHRDFRRARRGHEVAIKKQADGTRVLAAAEAERDAFDHREQAAQGVRDETIQELQDLAEELKELARTELIKRLRDLSFTDTVLSKD